MRHTLNRTPFINGAWNSTGAIGWWGSFFGTISEPAEIWLFGTVRRKWILLQGNHRLAKDISAAVRNVCLCSFPSFSHVHTLSKTVYPRLGVWIVCLLFDLASELMFNSLKHYCELSSDLQAAPIAFCGLNIVLDMCSNTTVRASDTAIIKHSSCCQACSCQRIPYFQICF